VKDEKKTKARLIEELQVLRARLSELEEDAPGADEKAEDVMATPFGALGGKGAGAARDMVHELKKLSQAIDNSVNLVFITDSTGRIEYVNPMFEQLTGWSKDEALGKNPRIISSGDTPVGKYAEMWKCILEGKTWKGVFKNRKKNGEFYWVSSCVSPVTDESGAITHFLAIQEDVTEKRSSHEKIVYLAHYDATTGLINRAHFIERLNEWICAPENAKGTGALFLLDLDQFKLITDAYGHGMGDELLRRVARMLQVTLRYVDSNLRSLRSVCAGPGTDEPMLARLSGDEYAIFIPSIGMVEAVAVAEQLRKGIEGFYQADVACHVTVSIGVSLFPEHGATTTDLLKKADSAMYRAKDLGRNRFHVFNPEERGIEKTHSRLKLKEEILSTLKEDRFEAWVQPILCLSEETVTHYEVLARMRDRDGSVVMPGEFIEIAERFGLVSSIARLIMEKAMRLQAATVRAGEPLTLGLNISGREIVDKEFLYFLQSKIYETGVDPARLIFEITETASIQDLDRAMAFIKEMKSLGCLISLDDFGIGYTSFLYLKEMQVDFIKIDGSFIKDLDRNLNDRLFVKAITDVASGMGIKTVAEFVETRETMDLLRELGVDYAQGYLVGKPRPTIEDAGIVAGNP